MRFNVCLAALAATLVAASPALAAPVTASASAEAHGVVLQPLTLAKISDLDFGTVIADPLTAGNVTIDADSGARSATGGATGVPSYPGGRGQFGGAATAGRVVTLTLTAPSLLVSTTNPADLITVNSLSLDSGGISRTIDATGSFLVGVGGDFAIAAGQPSGLYKATFDLTAEYQ